jgi:hypothetical protein
MDKNKNLHKAKKDKNDEFYTQLSDIEKEISYYKEHLRGKVVFLNCDDPEESMFWNYFALNFEFFGLKKLVSTHFESVIPSYKLELVYDINNDGKINKLDTIKTPLKQNGDFRSQESIEILKECDIVITNPPFSLFREYIAQLIEYDKKFIVLGNMNAITYKEIFKLIKDNKLWLGVTSPKIFTQPDKTIKEFGNIMWFTNLQHQKRNEEIILYKTYYGNESGYTKYDNYDAIEVSKVKDIPIDYDGLMGVPITFLDKFNPNQFEIIWTTDRGGDGMLEDYKKKHDRFDSPVVNGKGIYKRIIIKKK